MNSFINKLKQVLVFVVRTIRKTYIRTRVPGWLRPHTQMDTKNSFTSALEIVRNQKKIKR